MSLELINLADSQIIEYELRPQMLQILIKDWEEKLWLLEFSDPYAFQAFAPEREDLSEICINKPGFFLDDVKEVIEEYEDDWNCFDFISAWSDKPVLSVVASSCNVSPFVGSKIQNNDQTLDAGTPG